MINLASSLISAAPTSFLWRREAFALLACALIGCAGSPSSPTTEAEVSQALTPCAEGGTVKGSMRRAVASDGTVTYVFTPDCPANQERPEQSKGTTSATETNGAR